MLYLYLYPGTAPLLSKWSIRGSLLGIALIVIGSASAGRLDVAAFGLGNVALVAGFTVALALMAGLLPRAMDLARTDASAIELEVIVRNVNLGVLIKASIFPAASAATGSLGDTVLFCLLLYGALQLLAGAVLVHLHRRAARW
jgi:BASS family bile acid:Na+ symporter